MKVFNLFTSPPFFAKNAKKGWGTRRARPPRDYQHDLARRAAGDDLTQEHALEWGARFWLGYGLVVPNVLAKLHS
jgi:hypothetical protein